MANPIGKIDLHMHTTISDGTDTPQELIGAVKAAGISLFSVTDHDAVKAAEILPPLLSFPARTKKENTTFSATDLIRGARRSDRSLPMGTASA